MTNDNIELRLTAAYNDGVLYAVQLMASEALRIVRNKTGLLNGDRAMLLAQIETSAKRILRRRGLLPNPLDVKRGITENVELNFYMRL